MTLPREGQGAHAGHRPRVSLTMCCCVTQTYALHRLQIV